MNSMEEDAFFKEWSWEKDLIKRRWESPRGDAYITFDAWVSHVQMGQFYEEQAMQYVKAYGVKQSGGTEQSEE